MFTRKLVIYCNEEALHDAGNYPCLVNYDHVRRFGEFDDGMGNTMHIDFAVAGRLGDLKTRDYDAVELIGHYDSIEFRTKE